MFVCAAVSTLARARLFAAFGALRGLAGRATMASATLPFIPGAVREDGTVTPHKPLSDKREYRIITLPNRLKVALIHDPAVDKAAACLTTAIGNLTDPPNLPGLSHFLEHMLFLGTTKFPEEASYKKFLKDHGGGSNASTSSEATTYHFFVHHGSLLGQGAALDRFMSFFTGPLMDPNATERELNAVDSENSKNLNDDGRREWQVRRHLSAPGHVFRKFGTGDRHTLSPAGVDVRAALLAHYERYYSSNIMGAAVLGRESLDALEAAVREGLAGVQDKDIPIPSNAAMGQAYQAGQAQQVAFLTPVRDIRSVNLVFPMPHTPFPDMSHAGRLLSHTLGYEGPGSLLTALKDRGWANSLSAGNSSFRQTTYFNIDVGLTAEGLSHVNEVVRMVLEYCAVAQRASEEEWRRIHAELRQTADNSVRFRPTTEPVSAVTSLATSLVDFDPLHVLTGRSLLPEQPDLPRLRDMLACFTPANMLLLVSAQKYGPEAAGMPSFTSVKEPYYGFEYATAPFSPAQRSLWGLRVDAPALDRMAGPAPMEEWTPLPSGELFPGKVDLTPAAFTDGRSGDYGKGLTMPPPNPFIPSDFELKPLEAGTGTATVAGTDSAAELVRGEGNGSAASPAASTPSPAAATAGGATESSVGVAALKAAAVGQANVDVVAAEAASPAVAAAAPVVAADGADPAAVPEVPADAEGGVGKAAAGGKPAVTLTLKTSNWDVVASAAAAAGGSSGAAGAPASWFALPMRDEFASRVFTFPSLYPEPKLLGGSGAVGDGVRAWYHQDGVFRLPKTYMTASFPMDPSKAPGSDPLKRIAASLAGSLVHELLNEPTYDARCAGLGYDLYTTYTGEVGVAVSGYSHTLPVLLQTVLDKATGIADEPDAVLLPVFDRLKDRTLRGLANFTKAQPHVRAGELVSLYCEYPFVAKERALEAAKAVTLDHVRDFLRGLLVLQPADKVAASNPAPLPGTGLAKFPPAPLEVLVSANTDAADAQEYAAILKDKLREGQGKGKDGAAAPAVAAGTDAAIPALAAPAGIPPFVDQRAVFLRPGSQVVITRPHPNPDEPNAAVEVIWQLGPSTSRMRALAAMLAQAWSQPAFDTLRTKEQLGYMVFSGTTTFADGALTAAYITVQGQVASVEHLQARIDAFASSFRAQLEAVTEEDFKQRADIVAHRMTEPTKTQSEAHGRLRSPFDSRRYNWHTSEATAAAVRGCTKADLLHLYDSAIMPEGGLKRKIVARVYAQPQTGKVKPAAPAAEGGAAAAPGGEKEAPIHDGGPSKVPAPHADEAPAEHWAFLQQVTLPLSFEGPAGAGAGSVPSPSPFSGTPPVGVWAPMLEELPVGVE